MRLSDHKSRPCNQGIGTKQQTFNKVISKLVKRKFLTRLIIPATTEAKHNCVKITAHLKNKSSKKNKHPQNN